MGHNTVTFCGTDLEELSGIVAGDRTEQGPGEAFQTSLLSFFPEMPGIFETVPICRADPCEDVPGAVPPFGRCARKTEGSQQWRGSLWFAFTLLVWVLVKFSVPYCVC